MPDIRTIARERLAKEDGATVKDWGGRIAVAMVYPNSYYIGMSNLGLMIHYDILNKHRNLLAERVYCPWEDMEAVMSERRIPLFSLETKHPVRKFDMLAMTLPYEQLFTNALNLLDGIYGPTTTIGIILCAAITSMAMWFGQAAVAIVAAVFGGALIERDVTAEFVEHALSLIDTNVVRPLKVAVDAGNGSEGAMAGGSNGMAGGQAAHELADPSASRP